MGRDDDVLRGAALKRVPRVRKDGLCALRTCRKIRNLDKPPKSNMSTKLIEKKLREDPFCSATCARTFFGVVWVMDEELAAKRARSMVAA